MQAHRPKHTYWIRMIALFVVAFGLLSIKEGGTILFGSEADRATAGNVVAFVLWFNFSAGLAYIAAGAGLWWQQRWAAWLAVAIAVATALVFLAFGMHVVSGAAYESRTVFAMALRLTLWTAIAVIAWRWMPGSQPKRFWPGAGATR